MPFLLSSCGSMKMPDVSLPMLNGDYRELSTAPKDASLYQCEKNKQFYGDEYVKKALNLKLYELNHYFKKHSSFQTYSLKWWPVN